MAVLAMATKYHRLGRALRRIMTAENVQVDSQGEFAQRISEDGGWPVGQQVISDYMRLHVVGTSRDDDQNVVQVERPRSIPPEGFILAVIRAFPLTPEQQEDLVLSWLAILPDKRREALLGLYSALRATEPSSEALRDMLDYEAERGSQQSPRGDKDEGPPGSRGEAI